MTDAENDEESAHHVRNSLACKYGYRTELVNQPAKLDYTTFFCCLISLTVILSKEVIYLVVITVLSVRI
jgi:hypothetical protein